MYVSFIYLYPALEIVILVGYESTNKEVTLPICLFPHVLPYPSETLKGFPTLFSHLSYSSSFIIYSSTLFSHLSYSSSFIIYLLNRT